MTSLSHVDAPRPATASERARLLWGPGAGSFDADRAALAGFAADTRARGWSPKTLKTYDSLLRTTAAAIGRPLLELTTADLRIHIGRDGIKNSTRNTTRAALAAFYRFAVWFPARAGRAGHISGPAVTDLIGDAIRRAGITDPKLTPQSLRHGFATSLVDAGVDIRVIQELMMHESLGSTQIYAGVSEKLMRDGIHRLPSRSIPQHAARPPRAEI
ncbi:tyrosine-type recombinase/integrase [Microbacterium sp.]|uniref:tyrosine-type recombinase/integrase n=1 Tax=Microbacterium sp. TaxID=51671 RepID=UPI0039E623DE